jgi:hypothetical protein
LGQGEEETALTDDCAMSTSGDEGAEEGPVNDMDEIGLIFNFEDIETKVCLKECGSFVKFNNKCLHRGYKKGSSSFQHQWEKEGQCKITWQNLRKEPSTRIIYQC